MVSRGEQTPDAGVNTYSVTSDTRMPSVASLS